MPLDFIVFSVFILTFCIATSYTDTWMHRIPNFMTFPMAALGILFHLVMYFSGKYEMFAGGSPIFGETGMNPAWSLAGLVVCFLFLFIPWLMGGAGAGDVKLLAALGAWLGIYYGFVMFAISMILAAIASLILWVVRKLFFDEKAQKVGGGGKKSKKEQDLSKRGKGNSEQAAAARKSFRVPKRALPYAVPVLLANIIVLAYMWQMFNK